MNTLPEESTSIFSVKQANVVMNEAKERPDSIPLYEKLWYEHELCCLFADSNLGKSIFAVQMADEIARRGKRVIYFDFEFSDKQFQQRYTSRRGVMHIFPKTFFRAEIASEKLDEKYDETLLTDIEKASIEAHVDVVIVDNLTWLCADNEKGGDAAKLMKALMKIKFKHNFSMLIIAHTPKRDMSRPITANDLAGSRKIFNFFDSVFAIGRSAKDENLRYIKQIKVRTGEFIYNAENVIVCSIEQGDDGFLHLALQGTASEREHLKEPSEQDRSNLKEQVRSLSQQGKSYGIIATELRISKSYVAKILTNR